MQPGLPNLTYEITSSGNPFIFGSTVKGQVHESRNGCRRGSLHSCEYWLLLVLIWQVLQLLLKLLNLSLCFT